LFVLEVEGRLKEEEVYAEGGHVTSVKIDLYLFTKTYVMYVCIDTDLLLTILIHHLQSTISNG